MIIKFLKNHWFLSSVIITLLALIFGYFYTKYSFKLLDYFYRKNLEFRLVQLEETVAGRVDSIYCSHGAAFVSLNNSSKIWFEVSENKSYDIPLLCEFIQIKDSIYKQTENDTLKIFRGNRSYSFKLGEINKRKKETN